MEDGKNCSMEKKCCWSKCLISVVAVFAFTMLFDWLVHGTLMKSLYAKNAAAFRPESQMQDMMVWCIAFHLVIAIVVTCMFKNYKNYSPEACAADPALAKKCTPCARGICFGTHLGLIFGAGMFATYIWIPVTIDLAIGWFFAGLLKGIGIGLVLSCFCGKKKVVM